MKPTKPSALSAPALVAGTSASGSPAGGPAGKSNSTTSTGIALPIDSLKAASSKTSTIGDHMPCPVFAVSPLAAPVRTSASWELLASIKRDRAFLESVAGYSSSAWRLSERWARSSSCSRTFQTCSIQTTAETFKQLSNHSPNAVTWGLHESSIHRLSEYPKNVAAFSWSLVLDRNPHPSSWLTLGQWSRYLARLARHGSQNRRMLGLATLLRLQTSTTDATAESIWAVSFSLLRKTDGIRWLTGPERLRYMGFPGDWMRPTLKRLMRQETPCHPRWQNGSLKF